tara:strand:- start:236 stop:2479 length:2244 start_codon:yes stop_codon:yes gene_type:complete
MAGKRKARRQVEIEFNAKTRGLTGELRNVTRSINRMGDRLEKTIKDSSKIWSDFRGQVVSLNAAFDLAGRAASGMAGVIRSTTGAALEHRRMIGGLAVALEGQGLLWSDVQDSVRSYMEELHRATGQTDEIITDVMAKIAFFGQGMNLTMEEIQNMSTLTIDMMEGANKTAEEASKIVLRMARGEFAVLKETMPGLSDELDRLTESGASGAEGMALLERTFGGVASGGDEVSISMARITQSTDELGRTVGNMIINTISGEGGFQSFADGIDDMVKSLQDSESTLGSFARKIISTFTAIGGAAAIVGMAFASGVAQIVDSLRLAQLQLELFITEGVSVQLPDELGGGVFGWGTSERRLETQRDLARAEAEQAQILQQLVPFEEQIAARELTREREQGRQAIIDYDIMQVGRQASFLNSLRAQGAAQEDINDALREFARLQNQLAEKQQEQSDAARTMAATFSVEDRQRYEALLDELETVNDVIEAGTLVADAETEMVNRLRTEIAQLMGEMEDFGDSSLDIIETFYGRLATMVSGIGDVLGLTDPDMSGRGGAGGAGGAGGDGDGPLVGVMDAFQAAQASMNQAVTVAKTASDEAIQIGDVMLSTFQGQIQGMSEALGAFFVGGKDGFKDFGEYMKSSIASSASSISSAFIQGGIAGSRYGLLGLGVLFGVVAGALSGMGTGGDSAREATFGPDVLTSMALGGAGGGGQNITYQLHAGAVFTPSSGAETFAEYATYASEHGHMRPGGP